LSFSQARVTLNSSVATRECFVVGTTEWTLLYRTSLVPIESIMYVI
jgi:hypothetical protein